MVSKRKVIMKEISYENCNKISYKRQIILYIFKWIIIFESYFLKSRFIIERGTITCVLNANWIF